VLVVRTSEIRMCARVSFTGNGWARGYEESIAVSI